MRGRFFLSLTAVVLGLTFGAGAAEAACPRVTQPQISFRIMNAEPTFHDDVSYRQISHYQMHNRQGNNVSGQNPVGATSAQLIFNYKYEPDIFSYMPPNKGACEQIAALNLDVGFESLGVYTARELGAGTCAEIEVRNFQEKQAEVARAYLVELEIRMRGMLEKKAAEVGFVEQTSEEKAGDLLKDKVTKAMNALEDEINDELLERLSKIETRDAVENLAAACGGAMQEFFR